MGKTKRNKNKGVGKRKGRARRTRKRLGGGLLDSIVGLRNINYIKLLEKRLVTKCNDYEWVQQQRVASMRMKKDRKDYD